MNSFEYGFFSELEKIATNKARVADWKQYFQKKYKGISSGLAGEAATDMVQSENNNSTRGQFEGPLKDPRFNDPNFRFQVSIPDPNVPGGRLVANREQRTKFLARRRRGVDRIPSLIYQTAPQRAKFGGRPYGL